MLKAPWRKFVITMPDNQVCLRPDLDGSLFGIHAIKLCRILRSQFDETLDIQALASEDTFRI